MSCKKYVEVTAKFDVDGTVFPLEIQWEDGAKFEIDRILDVRQAASLKAGGTGIRYTCRGAFTGAEANKTGYFLEADGGTLFLDEVGNLTMEMQQMLTGSA